MSSAAGERPAGRTPEYRRGAARRDQRDRHRLRMAVAAAVAVLMALLAGAVILLRLSSESTRVGSSGTLRVLTPLALTGGLGA